MSLRDWTLTIKGRIVALLPLLAASWFLLGVILGWMIWS